MKNNNSINKDDKVFGNAAKKYKDTVHYKGVLRIVGKINEPVANKTEGYAIMNEKTFQVKAYTVEQTVFMLKNYKFSNAELQDNKIVNTECSMDRLMIFDRALNVIANPGIIILGQIKIDNKTQGFKILSNKGAVVEVSESDLIFLEDKGIPILNAKIVTRSNSKTKFISAIKSEFTVIERSVSEQRNDNKVSTTKEKEWRKQKYREKVINRWVPRVLTNATQPERSLRALYFPVRILWYKDVNEDERCGHFEKTVDVMVKEILPNYIRTNTQKELLKSMINKFMPLTIKIDRTSYSCEASSDLKYNKLLAVGLCQFLLLDDKIYDDVKKYALARIARTCRGSVYEELNKLGFTIKEFDNLIKDIDKQYEEGYKPRRSMTEFSTTKFVSSTDCAQIGFAITKANENIEYTTLYGNKYHLKYIGNYMNSEDYAKYSKMATCLGDLLIIAQIEKARSATFLSSEDKLKVTELMLAILSIYRPDIVKDYIETHELNDLAGYELLPGINFDEKTNYNLPSDLYLYYESGFNVFLNDNGYKHSTKQTLMNETSSRRRFRSKRLENSVVINYRALPIQTECKHPLLYNELAAVVNLITSDNIDAEFIDEHIGKLRYI